MKILIAVPTFENIYPDTYQSIFDLDKGEHNVSFAFVRGYDCATARNRIAQKALDKNMDYVLMVDNDVVLPRSVLLDMLDDPKDVCLGYYAHRDDDNIYRGRVSVCRLKDPDGNLYFNYPLESEYLAEEIGRLKDSGTHKLWIHGGGMGCALIRTDVFRKIPYPWYDWVNYADDHRGTLSEDLYFCEQCRKAGILVWTDTRVGCGHMLRHVQWPVWQKGDGMYRVTTLFDDLQDKVPTANGLVSWRYFPGDTYPRKGAEPSAERIMELMSDRNAQGKPLIEEIPDQDPEGEPDKEAQSRPKRTRKKKE